MQSKTVYCVRFDDCILRAVIATATATMHSTGINTIPPTSIHFISLELDGEIRIYCKWLCSAMLSIRVWPWRSALLESLKVSCSRVQIRLAFRLMWICRNLFRMFAGVLCVCACVCLCASRKLFYFMVQCFDCFSVCRPIGFSLSLRAHKVRTESHPCSVYMRAGKRCARLRNLSFQHMAIKSPEKSWIAWISFG